MFIYMYYIMMYTIYSIYIFVYLFFISYFSDCIMHYHPLPNKPLGSNPSRLGQADGTTPGLPGAAAAGGHRLPAARQRPHGPPGAGARPPPGAEGRAAQRGRGGRVGCWPCRGVSLAQCFILAPAVLEKERRVLPLGAGAFLLMSSPPRLTTTPLDFALRFKVILPGMNFVCFL